MLIFLLIAHVLGIEGHLAVADQFAQRGMFVYAIQQVDTVLSKGKGGEDAYALRGLLMGVRGRYTDAKNDFEYGMASDRLWHKEGEALANVERITGDCAAASYQYKALRQVGRLPINAHLRVYAAEIDSLRECNFLEQAWDIQSQMEAQFPNAVLTHASAADLYLDEGNLEAAQASLWLSSLYYRHTASLRVEARMALVEQRYQDASKRTRYIQTQRVSDREKSLQFLALLLSNDPSAVIHQGDKFRWRFNENPILLYIRLIALERLGYSSQYAEEKAFFDLWCDTDCLQRTKRIIAVELGGVAL